MKRTLARLAICAASALAATAPAGAQSPAPRTYALVSAIGSTMTVVRQRKQTGSMIDRNERLETQVPGRAIDAAVLRGLERIVREEDPEAEVVYMALDPRELASAFRYERGEVALGKVAGALGKMPQRGGWHRILVVTPGYMNSGREGLGDKLHGIGIYVQNTEKLPRNNEDFARRPDATRSLEGTPGESDRWIAPFFYAQVSVIDPRTLRVLETRERWDFEKLFDPASIGHDVELDFPPDVMGARLERFVELATADALREMRSSVRVSEPRIVTQPARSNP